MALSDFTSMNGVGITIAGVPLLHRIYHGRIPQILDRLPAEDCGLMR
jgi:hypothetical protein